MLFNRRQLHVVYSGMGLCCIALEDMFEDKYEEYCLHRVNTNGLTRKLNRPQFIHTLK